MSGVVSIGKTHNSIIDSLESLRVFAISIVVLRHVFSPYNGAWKISEFYMSNPAIEIISNYISSISMPLYVFISGFLYSYLRNELNKYNTYLILIKKKIRRLLVPYLILAPIYIVFFLDFSTTKEFVQLLLEGPGHLWFILMIFITFLIFYPLETIFKKKFKKGLAIILLMFLIGPIFYILGIPIISKVCEYIPFFYLGYLFYYKNDTILKFIEKKFWFFFIAHILLFTIYTILPDFLNNQLIINLYDYYKLILIGLLSVTFVFILFTKTKSIKSRKNDKYINLVNKNSYYIYIIHQPILEILFGTKLFQELPIMIVISVAFIISFFCSMILGNIIMNFKLGKALIGA